MTQENRRRRHPTGGVDIRVKSATNYDPSYSASVDLCSAVSENLNLPMSDVHYLLSRCKNRGRGYVLLNNVAEGFAFDFLKEIQEYSDVAEFDAVPAKWATSPVRRSVSMSVDRLENQKLALSYKVSELEHQIEVLQNNAADLKGSVYSLERKNVDLTKRNEKLERALQSKFGDVRVDPNDPDTYVVRPSALSEMRSLGRLHDDVINIVFQIPKISANRKMQRGGNWSSGADPDDRLLCSVDYGYAIKQLRRACRPNTRGSLRGTVRVLNMLRHITHTCCMLELNHLHDRKKSLRIRNSKFEW